jgi:hypothetical protein
MQPRGMNQYFYHNSNDSVEQVFIVLTLSLFHSGQSGLWFDAFGTQANGIKTA